MTDYYVDATLSTGNNDGSSKTDAWQSLQEAIDSTNNAGKPAAGDTVYCRHTTSPDEQPTVRIDVDGTTGATGSSISWIGVNSSWVEDGTKYEIDFQNATSTHGLYFASTVDITVWKHFEVYNADDTGFYFYSGSGSHIIIDCISRNNGDDGFDASGNTYGLFIGCLAYGNTSNGIHVPNRGGALFCCSRDNGGVGFYCYNVLPGIQYNCLSFDNSQQGYATYRSSMSFINCIGDNNGSDQILVDSYSAYVSTVLGCRFTNAPSTKYGINADSGDHILGYNYFEDNAAGNINNGGGVRNLNLVDSTSTDQEDQADTNAGYTSLTEGAEDYNLDSDATGFSQEITIPTGQ